MTTLLPPCLPFRAIEGERREIRHRQASGDEFGTRRGYAREGHDSTYRSLVEQMQQGAATLRADGIITYCNHRLAELLDVPRERLIGAALDYFVAAEDRPGYNNLLRRAQLQPGSGEARLQRANGELVPVYLTFTAVPDDCLIAIGVLVTDLTKKHQHDQLEAELVRHERAEESLRKSAAELSDADRHKNEFLATLAHELRNSLASIRNALYVLRTTEDAAVASSSRMMERQVSQLVRLVDDLLDVSRINRGTLELRLQRVDLASIVRDVVEAARPLAEKLDQLLTFDVPPEPVYLNVDATRLAQVLDNLLNNASKFTDKGGCIRLGLECSSDQVVIRVRDTGIGIAAGKLPRIFDMFMQVDLSHERSRSGLGIGLTLVKRLVELHGGTVDVTSAGIGQGSEFVVRLPVAVETMNAPAVPVLTASSSADDAQRASSCASAEVRQVLG